MEKVRAGDAEKGLGEPDGEGEVLLWWRALVAAAVKEKPERIGGEKKRRKVEENSLMFGCVVQVGGKQGGMSKLKIYVSVLVDEILKSVK